MSSWNGLDYFIFLIFLLNTLLGMARGATKEIVSIMCLCAALVFTIKFTIPLSHFINSSPLIIDVLSAQITQNFMLAMGLPPLTQATLFYFGYSIALLICFVGVFSACEAVLAYTGVIQVFSFPFATLDRKLGAALGCVRGYAIAVIFILIYLFISNGSGSYFINLFENSAKKLNYLIALQAPEKYKEFLNDKNLFDEKKVLDALENPK